MRRRASMPVPTAVNTDSQQLGKFGPPAVPERKAENLWQVPPSTEHCEGSVHERSRPNFFHAGIENLLHAGCTMLA
jgi:hypothetical protein